jgi:excisionase family DNA binding protein
VKPSHITVTEAAQVLRVSPQRVRKLVERGKLPAVRSGRHWLVARAAVIARARAVTREP